MNQVETQMIPAKNRHIPVFSKDEELQIKIHTYQLTEWGIKWHVTERVSIGASFQQLQYPAYAA